MELRRFKSHAKIRWLNQTLNPHVLSMKVYTAYLSIKVTTSHPNQVPPVNHFLERKRIFILPLVCPI